MNTATNKPSMFESPNKKPEGFLDQVDHAARGFSDGLDDARAAMLGKDQHCVAFKGNPEQIPTANKSDDLSNKQLQAALTATETAKLFGPSEEARAQADKKIFGPLDEQQAA
jgi:hypothetical protein